MVNILIVDDEQTIREGIRSSIDWGKYGISICDAVDNGFMALNIIERDSPEIVITDIRMSDMNGLELLQIVKEKYPMIKVILISAYNDFQYAQKALELNAFYYLLKPIDSEKLLQKVLEAKNSIQIQYEKIKLDLQLNNRLKSSIPILRDNFFKQLINGKISDTKIINERMDFLKVDLKGPQYLSLILQIDEGYHNKTTSEYDKNLFKLAVMDTSEELFKGESYNCVAFNLEDTIGLIIHGEELNRFCIQSTCKTLQQWANNSIGLSLTISMGKIHSNFTGIPISYREALDALEYKLIIGRNEIIDIEEIYKNEGIRFSKINFQELLNTASDRLSNSIKTSNYDSINAIIDEIIANFEQVVRANIKDAESLLFILCFFLTKSLISLDINFEKLSSIDVDLFNELKKLATIGEIKAYIHKYIDTIIVELNKTQTSHNSFLINKAIESINSNLYTDVSLTGVAKSVYVNPNYLSKIFKQETGKSFIEYVTEMKMNEAKKLLKTSHHKIYEIADMLQYRDVNHFTKVFKKVYGVSPTEYRELM